MKMRPLLARWGFSSKERWGIVLFALLVLIVLFIPEIRRSFFVPVQSRIVVADTLFQGLIDSPNEKANDPRSRVTTTNESGLTVTLFYFDPNNIDETGWKRLGLPQRSITTIMRYKAKGGRFRKAADIHRIYGLSPILAKNLEPFVRITDSIIVNTTKNATAPYRRTANSNSRERVSVYDINEADSIQWESLPGIGAKLAHRILQFKNNLGGFYSIDQLKEVYGLPDSTFQKIVPRLICKGNYLRIDLNTAELDQLSQHPYIKRKAARMIQAWRKQHGDITELDHILLSGALDTNNLRKLRPYLLLVE